LRGTTRARSIRVYGSMREPALLTSLSLGTARTALDTLSLHDALPISGPRSASVASHHPYPSGPGSRSGTCSRGREQVPDRLPGRSEEHTSELQSRENLVCRLRLEKKKRTPWYRHDVTPLPRSTYLEPA